MTLNNKSRENIIRETVKLVQKNGYAGTSIQDIIKKSKAPKGSMYYYFPKGKDDMIGSSLDKIDAEFQKKFKNAVASCENLSCTLTTLVDLFKHKEKVYGTPSFRLTLLALETIGQDPVVAEKCSDILKSWKKLLAESIENVGIDAEVSENISEWFFTTVQGSICASVIQDDTAFMKVADQSIKLVQNMDAEALKEMFS
ncbi:TetR/AcrR family transcriptional regulator [Gemella sp. zg-570]|uniref:TetR/AcrR family transcriptional regulator n=1 Tax=Gemella sp. zg-570 TaxID=2840371 RepID=UPI001C0B8307|nr:TetR/AcrR family transcriptional regulator [Gemella sp. zg-570]QWQ38265.1 TetR/AcrR family transcriptional regulator [Gemella sp. zg-570]